jgi:xanthine dehydrogenase molybdopterin-binding subunit B
MSGIVNLSRRDFLKTSAMAGGGLILGLHLPFGASPTAATAKAASFSPNAFIRVGHDGAVTFILNKSEMGQGVYTSLAMLIAEELECDWKGLGVDAAPVDPDAAVVLKTFVDSNRNLHGKAIVSGIDGRTDNRGEAGINEHLAAHHDKNALPLRVSCCGVSDAIDPWRNLGFLE